MIDKTMDTRAMDDLMHHLRSMETDELAQRVAQGYFAEHAIARARQELAARGIDPTSIEHASSPDTDDSTGQDWVILKNRLDPVEATIMRIALEETGIPALVDDLHTVNAMSHISYALSGVRVRVPAGSLDQARQLVAAIDAGEHALTDEDDHPATSSMEDRLFAFTGNRSWAHRWDSRGAPLPGFMWPALLFGPVWFVYHKMYLNGIILLGMEALTISALPRLTGSLPLALMAFFGIRFLTACVAERIYCGEARARIRLQEKIHHDEAGLLTALRKEGRVNLPAAIAMTFAINFALILF